MEKALRARHDLHLARKTWHMSTGLFGYAVVIGLDLNLHLAGLGLLAFAVLGFLVEAIRLRTPQINRRIITLMGPLMRSSEQNSCSGLPFYALGVGASLLLFERDIALISILFLVFADPISSLFGILHGKHRLISGKSLEGSMAGFVTCYIISFLWISSSLSVIGPHVVLFCVLAGLIGSLSELLSVFADDNLTIPLLSGAGITVINFLIPLL